LRCLVACSGPRTTIHPTESRLSAHFWTVLIGHDVLPELIQAGWVMVAVGSGFLFGLNWTEMSNEVLGAA